MARRKKKEEHVNHERWLVSYADFITLLFAFFTSLYAISTVDAKKAGKMVFSTRAAFNMDFFPSDKPVLGYSNPAVSSLNVEMSRSPKTSELTKPSKNTPLFENRVSTKTLAELKQDLESMVKKDRINDHVHMHFINNNLVISLNDVAFFAPGSATLRDEAIPPLDKIAEKLVALHLSVRVEGHSDDSPPGPGHYKSNWELSTGRGLTVVHYLMDAYGYPPDMLSVAGFASSKPVDSNESPSGRANNRRVDIVLLASKP